MKWDTTTGSSFSETLFGRANHYFASMRNGKYATYTFYAKTFFVLFLYVSAYVTFLFFTAQFGQLVLLAILLGICHVLIPLSFSHDAIHHSISSKHWINTLCLYGFELTGSNSFIYSKKHLEAHANKENGSKQMAVESQGLLIQKKRESGASNLPVYFYLFYAQYMIFLRDFIIYFSDKSIPRHVIIRLVACKLIYAFAFIVLPFMYIPLPGWQIGVAMLLMYFFVTAFLVIILLMPTEKMEQSRVDGINPNNDKWLIEVLEHNVDFSPGSVFLNLAGGGANLNVVHYLFPGACHVHYNQLARIIESTASEFGLHYRKQRVRDVFGIHFKYLRNIQEVSK